MKNLLGEEYIERADIPVIGMTPEQVAALEHHIVWFDQRQVCRHVLRVVAGGPQPESLSTCWFHRAGKCAMCDGHVMCAFYEWDSDVWAKAQDWRYVPGVGAVHRSLWVQFGITDGSAPQPPTNGRSGTVKR